METVEKHRESRRKEDVAPMEAFLSEFNLETGRQIALDLSLGDPSPQLGSFDIPFRLYDKTSCEPRTLTINYFSFAYEKDSSGNSTFAPKDAQTLRAAIHSFWDGKNKERSRVVHIPADER